MLTSQQIAAAKRATKYGPDGAHHEHDDCVRIAYEWLDAQDKTQGVTKKTFAIKHIIERWAGRYVSQSDVEVAAHLHPGIRGTYPRFNISSRLREPSLSRLEGIGEAGKHENYRERNAVEVYASRE